MTLLTVNKVDSDEENRVCKGSSTDTSRRSRRDKESYKSSLFRCNY